MTQTEREPIAGVKESNFSLYSPIKASRYSDFTNANNVLFLPLTCMNPNLSHCYIRDK